MVLTVFLVAVGFRLAALTLPTDERRRVNRIAIQITLAAAALGIGVGLVTPLPPLVTMIVGSTAGAIAATAMILGQGASHRASNLSLTPGFSLSSLARRSGRLAGAHAGQATAFGGALRDLLEQFERDFGPWVRGNSMQDNQRAPERRVAPSRSQRPAMPPTGCSASIAVTIDRRCASGTWSWSSGTTPTPTRRRASERRTRRSGRPGPKRTSRSSPRPTA